MTYLHHYSSVPLNNVTTVIVFGHSITVGIIKFEVIEPLRQAYRGIGEHVALSGAQKGNIGGSINEEASFLGILFREGQVQCRRF